MKRQRSLYRGSCQGAAGDARMHNRKLSLWMGLIWAMASLLMAASPAGAQVTTRTDEIGKLLNAWYSEGTAGGLSGVTYENRDGGHSMFEYGEYPQLKLYQPSEEEKAKKLDITNANRIHPTTTFSNSSMAAPAERGGSLPQFYFTTPKGLSFLAAQYYTNNLSFYPEHKDYHIGANGHGGYGDMFPANTPYLVISQGSSWTDRPFMRCFFSALAAFRPEVRDKLIQSKFLIPTLQALFRSSNANVVKEEDYFTGAAHPPVFRGSELNEDKFVHAAHSLTLFAIPAVPLLTVTREDECLAGRDYFESQDMDLTEHLGDSPGAIARVFRGASDVRHIVVSARKSVGMQGRPLIFKWVLLQGDPNRVKIAPSLDGSSAEIEVHWHPGFRIPSGITTHRVDIGVFVSNGVQWSAPAFVTFYMLPNEARFYDAKGRVTEICYHAGNPDSGLPATTDLLWLSFAHKLAGGEDSLGFRLLRQALTKTVLRKLDNMSTALAEQQAVWRRLKDTPKTKPEADAALAKLQQEIQKRLAEPVEDGGYSLFDAVEKGLFTAAENPDLCVAFQEQIRAAAKGSPHTIALSEIEQAEQALIEWRVLKRVTPYQVALNFLPKEATAGDRYQLRELNLSIFSEALLPDYLDRSTAPAFVDPRLTTIKDWRDIYHYDASGSKAGWTRIMNGRKLEFDAEGNMKADGKVLPVRYTRDTGFNKLLFSPAS